MFGRISSYRQRTFLATLSGPAGSRSLPLDFDYLVSDVVVVVKQSPVLIVFPVIASALITYSILERTISLIWLHRSAGVNAHCFSVRRDALAKFPFFIPRPVMLCQNVTGSPPLLQFSVVCLRQDARARALFERDGRWTAPASSGYKGKDLTQATVTQVFSSFLIVPLSVCVVTVKRG